MNYLSELECNKAPVNEREKQRFDRRDLRKRFRAPCVAGSSYGIKQRQGTNEQRELQSWANIIKLLKVNIELLHSSTEQITFRLQQS